MLLQRQICVQTDSFDSNRLKLVVHRLVFNLRSPQVRDFRGLKKCATWLTASTVKELKLGFVPREAKMKTFPSSRVYLVVYWVNKMFLSSTTTHWMWRSKHNGAQLSHYVFFSYFSLIFQMYNFATNFTSDCCSSSWLGIKDCWYLRLVFLS